VASERRIANSVRFLSKLKVWYKMAWNSQPQLVIAQ
jgi:hypothetical protein